MISKSGAESGHIAKLRERLAHEGGAAVFAGAGVSIHATSSQQPAASWKGLLEDGLRRCVEEHGADEAWHDAVRALIVADQLARAGDLITEKLGGREGNGAYAEWLRDTVGSLRCEDRSWPEALVRLGPPLVTTNYDDLLAEASGRPVVTWQEKAKLHDFFRGDYEAVLHLHGHWRTPESVVLGSETYEGLRRDRIVQNGLRAWLTMRTAIFVGYGGGLDDPNFSALRAWVREVLGGSRHPHYLLVRDGDFGRARELFVPRDRIVPIAYGPTWEHLPAFLRDLRPASSPSSERQRHRAPAPHEREPSELETLHKHREDLRAAGGDTAAIDREILDLKRSLREGPMPIPGAVFGDRYVLEERLGEGGIGHVWKAWDGSAKHYVALKFLHGAHVGNRSCVQRFFRGAKKQALLNHPHVVHVLDPDGRDAGWFYFAMELVPGTNLQRAVLDRSLARDEILRVLGEVAEALDYAWDKEQLIHRDVKPANVLLDAQRKAYLTDFDLVLAPASTQGTREGQILGTYPFVAPEILAGSGEATTRKSDVWSFAMTALWALSGARVHRAGAQEIKEALALSCLSRRARRAVRACLHDDPERRLGSPGELVAELTRGGAWAFRFARNLLVAAGALVVAWVAWWMWERSTEPGPEPKDEVPAVVETGLLSFDGLTRVGTHGQGHDEYTLMLHNFGLFTPPPCATARGTARSPARGPGIVRESTRGDLRVS